VVEAQLPEDAVAPLISVLGSARRRGFLGPAPVEDQLQRSLAFARVIAHSPSQALDLGSGGGLPGLVLAAALPTTTWYLLDGSPKRAEWLHLAVGWLGLRSRCGVLCGRAEDLGRTDFRNKFDLVTTRSFGPPAPTAECAAPFLRVGGEVAVADPPAGPAGGMARWPRSGLELLGLEWAGSEIVSTSAGPVTLSRLIASTLCPDRYPRRTGVPFKRPLF
jgi:16S rRNA (guanine527-N7)-methyltransferase